MGRAARLRERHEAEQRALRPPERVCGHCGAAYVPIDDEDYDEAGRKTYRVYCARCGE